jgi:predicted nucleic-acid-binding Zn-ribbon protein
MWTNLRREDAAMSTITNCPQCGHTELNANEIEIRKIDPKTRKINSTQTYTEWECKACGWFGKNG